jgi:hypothetical protein
MPVFFTVTAVKTSNLTSFHIPSLAWELQNGEPIPLASYKTMKEDLLFLVVPKIFARP